MALSVAAFDNKPVVIGIEEPIIENQVENCMDKFPFAVCEGGHCCVCPIVFPVEVLYVVQ